jgi:hypothetical protein
MRGLRRTLVALVVTALAGGGAAAAQAVASGPEPVRPSATRPTDPYAHDPTMAREGAYHYVVITGDATKPGTFLPVKRSKDLVHWEELGPVFTALPAWITAELNTSPSDAWAPDLVRVGDHWSLYYAVSQFGTQNSVIGLATTKTLDPKAPGYGWQDQGLVLRSTQGVGDFNAIDPEYVADGKDAWLAFGSFWGGLKLRRLDPATGKPSAADPTVHPLSSRLAPDAEEGPALVRRGGYWYLFLSFDFCCRGVESDYRMMVGRSKSLTGPYLDRDGVALLGGGGGSEVLRGSNEFVGTGGGDVLVEGPDTWLVNHYYDATDGGAPRLNVRPVTWRDGWPSVGDPLNGSRTAGHGDAFVRIVERSTGGPVTAVGCGYEGADLTVAPTTEDARCGQWQVGNRGNGTTRLLNRFTNKIAEVSACDNRDGGRVAQWGWIGFLPNNDCQRWTVAPAADGWSRLSSVLAGNRVLDVAGCNDGGAKTLVIRTAGADGCQDFRFDPVGPVLLVDDAAGPSLLRGDRCPAGGTVTSWPARTDCRAWKVQPAGSATGPATYTVTEAATGRRLGTAACGTAAPALRLLGPAERPCTVTTRWTLVPGNDGTWTLAATGAALSRTVRVLQP